MNSATLDYLIKGFDRTINLFAPNRSESDSRRLSSDRLLIAISLITSLFSLLYVSVSLYIDFQVGVWLMLSCFALLYVILCLFKTTARYRLCANLYLISCCIVAILGCSLFSGGLRSMVFPWLALIPVAGVLLFGHSRTTLFWFLLCSGLSVAYGVAATLGFDFPELYRVEHLQFFYTICVTGLVMILFFIALTFDHYRSVALCKLLEQNDELHLARIEAEAATKAKGEFLANMSHEIRTPMNAIIGFTELCQKSEMNDTQQSYLSHIESASMSLLRVVNDILDFSKAEADMLRLEKIDFNLEKVVGDAANMLSLKADKKALDLKTTIDPALPPRLVGDPLRLGQVLGILADNAVKFTDSGSVRIRAELVAGDEYFCEIRFTIQDTGIGISDEELTRLFVAFSQADTSVTRKFGGTGLGLVIAKKIVVMMGGEIEVNSTPGQGSIFSFTSRFERAKQAPPRPASLAPPCDEEGPGQQGNAGEQNTRDRAARVLVVDDNQANQQIAGELLKEMGLAPEFAANGQEAVDAVTQTPYDLVIMDLQMPLMSGYEATRLLRTDERFCDLPIIAMTAHALPGTREECLAAGMNDYLSKPVAPAKFHALLKRWLRPDALHESNGNGANEKNSTDVRFPEHLGGFDLEEGLELLDNNRALYHELIVDFAARDIPKIRQLRKLLEEGRRDEAFERVHALKGVAGNLSASEVYRLTSALEELLDGPASNAEDVLVAALEKACAVVTRSVAELEQ